MFDESQLSIINELKNGHNVMMLGIAGSGKSYLIKKLKTLLPDKEIYLTSTTGVSAINIGGTTVHSFFGVGLGVEKKEVLYNKMKNYKKVVDRLRKENVLVVVDEVSMMSSDLLTKIDYICQRVRNNPCFFGGIQFLFSGDFLQLETINENNILDNPILENFKIIQLQKNYRQDKDDVYQGILQNLRYNELTDEQLKILEACQIDKQDIEKYDYPILFPLSAQVVKYNTVKYNSINEKERVYKSEILGKCKFSKKKLEDFLTKKDAKILKLKKGVRVMLTWNIDIENNLVNGSTGVVHELFDAHVNVKFDNIKTPVAIVKQSWNIVDDDGRALAQARQIPLVVCYALTIHKCQGVTLTNVMIDLEKCFCNHQIYVALSRVKSLAGLKLLNFDKEKISTNDFIVEFYKKLQES